MLCPAIPANEPQRLEALAELGLVDSPAEERFDRITELAQQVLVVPIALVSLVSADRQWFKSLRGLNIRETPRELSFCAHAILRNDLWAEIMAVTIVDTSSAASGAVPAQRPQPEPAMNLKPVACWGVMPD